jgi:hypothetical protein
VLWLNERDLDIRCVRLRPYTVGDRVLLDIQQVLPLPEAEEYQVQIRKKAAEERQSGASGSDWTRYDLTINGETFPNLYKRKLFFLAIRAFIQHGLRLSDITKFIPQRKFLVVPEKCLTSEEFREKASKLRTSTGISYDLNRFYVGPDELFHIGNETYAVSNQWSKKRLPWLDALMAKYPQVGVAYAKTSQNGSEE